MAITNYTELQAAIVDYLDDETMTARIPDFIRLFEAKARRVLRTSDTTETSIGTTDANGQISLPVDFLGVRRLSAGGVPLTFITPEDAQERNARASGRSPYAYAIEGRVLTIVPAGIADIVLYYYKTLPVLSATNPTNWLLDRDPDAYLYGALAEAEGYGFNDARLATWRALASDSLAQVVGSDFGSEWANAATVVPDPVW